MSHAIPVFIAIGLCLAAAGVVSWDLWPLIQPVLAAFHAGTLAEARARHGQHAKLRARIPVVRTASPDGTAAAPAAAAVPLTPYALAPVLYDEHPHPAETITDLPAIDDWPRVPPYFLKHENEGLERWWLE